MSFVKINTKPKLICCHICCLVFVIILWFSLTMASKFGMFDSYEVVDKQCAVRDGIKGAEDITRYNSDIALMGSADRSKFNQFSLDISEPKGIIYGVSGLSDPNADITKLPVFEMNLEGYPD